MSARFWSRVLVVFVSAAFPCLVAEVVLRVLAPPADTPGLFLLRSDELEYLGRPHAHGLISGAQVSFNSLGLRDRDRPKWPDQASIRIAMLGDSITFGVGVKEEQTFPRVTETLLNHSRVPGAASVEVLNFGMPAYNTFHELAMLRQVALAFHPNVVVLGFLYNDLETSPAQRSRLAAASGAQSRRTNEGPHALPRGGSQESTTSNAPVASAGNRLASRINASLDWLGRRSLFVSWFSPRAALVLRPMGIKAIGHVGDININDRFADSNPDWQHVRGALLEMKQLCDVNGIRFEIVIIPAMTKFTESTYSIKPYHKAVSDFCRTASIACLDLLPAFWGLDGTRFWISLTDAHPNVLGHRIIGEALSRFLQPALEDIRGFTRPSDSTMRQRS